MKLRILFAFLLWHSTLLAFDVDLGLSLSLEDKAKVERFQNHSLAEVLDQLAQEGLIIIATSEEVASDPRENLEAVPEKFIQQELYESLPQDYHLESDGDGRYISPGFGQVGNETAEEQSIFFAHSVIVLRPKVPLLTVIHEYLHYILNQKLTSGRGFNLMNGYTYRDEAHLRGSLKTLSDELNHFLADPTQAYLSDRLQMEKYHQVNLQLSEAKYEGGAYVLREEIIITAYLIDLFRSWGKLGSVEEKSEIGLLLGTIREIEQSYDEIPQWIIENNLGVNAFSDEFKAWYSTYKETRGKNRINTLYNLNSLPAVKAWVEQQKD